MDEHRTMFPSMTDVEEALFLVGRAYLKWFDMPKPVACWPASSDLCAAVEFEVYLPLDEKLILCQCRVSIKFGANNRVDIVWFSERFDEPGVTRETLLVDDLGVTWASEPVKDRRIRANSLKDAVKQVFSLL